jgi:hypothetical protein
MFLKSFALAQVTERLSGALEGHGFKAIFKRAVFGSGYPTINHTCI